MIPDQSIDSDIEREPPSGWARCTVGEIASSERNSLVGGPFGSNLVSRDYTNSGVPIIRGQNMSLGRWVAGDFAFVSEEKAGALFPNTARPGDIIFTQRGTLGQVAVVPPRPYERYIVSQSQMKLTVDNTKADPLFIYYAFTAEEQQAYSHGNAIQTGVPHTNLGILRQASLILPPLPEQRAIAHILGTLDDKIELNRRTNQTLEAMARAIFTSWFVDFDPVRAKAAGRQPEGMDAETAALFPSAFEDSPLGRVPLGWQVAALADAIQINPARKLLNGVAAPYLDMANMPTTGSRALNWSARPAGSGARFMNGDVLLARITPCLENGKTAFVDFLEPEQLGWGSTEYIVLRSMSPLPPEYAYFVARDEAFRNHAIRSMTGSSGRQRVQTQAISGYPVVVPHPNVARRFGEIARLILAKLKANDDQSRTLAAMRDLLLPKLLSGEVRVPDAEHLVQAAS